MSDRKNTTFVVLAGVVALGILAAAISGSQMLNADAQTSGEQEKQASGASTDEDLPTSAPYHHEAGTSTISTSGTATVKVKPDKFSVTVGVETNGTTAQEAAGRNADLMAKVISALRALGISEDQISTSYYNVYPVYEYRHPTEPCILIYPPPPECQPKNVITGYRASNSLTVTLDAAGDVDAGKVIDAAIEAGVNSVNGVFFFVSQEKQQEIRDGLIREAIASARHRAEIAASAVGMEITGVQSINLNDVYFPVYSRGAFDVVAESAPTPILPGEQEISNTVSVVFTFGSGSTAGAETNN